MALAQLLNCPYCGQGIINEFQTICYGCGFFLLVHRVFEEKKRRATEKEKITKIIETELEGRVRRGESEYSLIREYKPKIREAEERIKSVIDEGFVILENRERYLRFQRQLSEDESRELNLIKEQYNELAVKGGRPFKIRSSDFQIDPCKILPPLAEAAKGALRGLDKSEQHAILSAIAGFFEGMQKVNIDRKEKTRLENDLEQMRERLLIHGAAIRSRRELEEMLSENILQLDAKLKSLGVSEAERGRRIDEFMDSLYNQQIIDNKEPYN